MPEKVKIRQSVDGETFVYVPSTGRWHSVRGVPKTKSIPKKRK